MKNKPQWLIDAENEINQFAETKIGKMTQKEYEFYERQRHANKFANEKMKKLGYPNLAKNWTDIEKSKRGGLAARDTHRKSGFMKIFCAFGSKATSDKYLKIRFERTEMVAMLFEDNKSYNLKEVYDLCKDLDLSKRQIKNTLDDRDGFGIILKTSSQGVAGKYKLINLETKQN